MNQVDCAEPQIYVIVIPLILHAAHCAVIKSILQTGVTAIWLLKNLAETIQLVS